MHFSVLIPHSRTVINHSGRIVHKRKMKGGGSPAVLLDNPAFDYPIRGSSKKSMVTMSGGSVMRTTQVRKPIKILL